MIRREACEINSRRMSGVRLSEKINDFFVLTKYAVEVIIFESVGRGDYRQAVKTQDCGSCMRGFESH